MQWIFNGKIDEHWDLAVFLPILLIFGIILIGKIGKIRKFLLSFVR